MLPKTKRVKKALFPKVFSSGRTLHSTYLTVRIIPPPPTKTLPAEPSRFSFVVSKAVAKKAADRNLMRRRGYEAISKIEEHLPKGLVAVFFYKKGGDKLTYKAICGEIESALAKSGLLIR